ncbi:Ig-like domain-containing protein [Melittangium boletus]|uniref:Ig-like domain-containing protein n=1 Tax=Melittangium boletus TaxID=83453 RepID=UPI003DA4B4AB
MSLWLQRGGRVLVLGFALLGGCGDGTEGEPVPPVQVEFLAPREMAVTRGDLGIALKVRGGVPDRMDLYVDEGWVTQLEAASYRWDTRDWPEGEHALTVRVVSGEQVFTTTKRKVVVDRSPPRIVSRQPAAGAQSVRKGDLIVLEFSEPLAPSAVDTLWLEAQASGDFPRTLRAPRLSTDRKTLGFADVTDGRVPYSLSVVVRGVVEDDAGNQGTPGSEAWSWQVGGY